MRSYVCCAQGFFFLVLCIVVRSGNNNNSRRKYTVSGISSGAFMAIQHHIAFNKDVIGVGALAGGPFYCAQAKLTIALTACMADPTFINLEELISITWATYTTTGTIDSPSYTKGDKIWLYSGTQEEKVKNGVVAKTYSYYLEIGANSEDMIFRNDIQSAHAMVTDNYGNNCTFFGEPYIDNCNFDAAGHILQHLLGGHLKPRVPSINTNIMSFPQNAYLSNNISSSTLNDNGFAERGYAYIPNGCQNGNMQSCHIHFAYHGCLQGLENINTTFILHGGYNGWGEANNIVIVYPQAKSSTLNPETCWDWWGFTGPAYASKIGTQLHLIGKMVDDWIGRK
jgi:poly(3-hydroxybutyrate) depolymerase